MLLFPPQSWQQLYLYPALHPGALSAQAEVGSAPTAADQFKFPNFRPEHLLGFECEVGPGDVLYIPPLWFHRVTTLDEDSISLSVWSPYLGSEKYADTVENASLPIRSKWAMNLKVAALRMLLESLVSSLKLPDEMNLAAFVHWTLVENRYLNVDPPATAKPHTEYCWERELEGDLLLDAEEMFMAGLKATVHRFRDIENVAGSARRDILLANYIELAANSVVGVANVKSFLVALTEC